VKPKANVYGAVVRAAREFAAEVRAVDVDREAITREAV